MNRSLPILLSVFLFLCAAPLWGQGREIRGRVTAATGEPVAGATVTVRGTRLAVVTEEDGSFVIETPPGEVTLVVSTLGYRTRQVTVPVGQAAVNVTLELDPLKLEELVVTGRATETTRRNLANAISTVTADELERAPAASVEHELQGKVAGAQIETNSGSPGGGVQVRLRGTSTINAESQPLYVVDGVVISDVAIPSNQDAVTRSTAGSNAAPVQDNLVNRVVDLNPEDIERVEVLKGASAAAIYGQKAANGVIVITTKRGTPGAPRVRLSQKFGFFDLATELGFRQFETVDEAVAAYGDPARAFFDPQSGRPKRVFDQEQLLAGRNDLSSETSVSVSGGSEATQYYVNGLWKNDEGIIQNTGFEKQSLRVNVDQQIGSRLKVSVSSNLIHTLAQRGLTNNDNSGTSFYMVFPFTPNFVDLRQRRNGTFPANPFERSNPLQTAALMKNNESVWRLIGGLSATWEPIRTTEHSVSFIGNFGVDHFNQTNDLFFPPDLQFEPQDGFPGTSLLSEAGDLNLNVGGNLVWSYTPESGAFRLTTSGGTSYERTRLDLSRVVSRGLSVERVDAGSSIDVQEEREEIRAVGFYLQEELLLLDERLLLSGGGRFDRSSTIGNDDRFFFYPKAAASYRFPELLGSGTELKLRTAWGQSGNLPLFGQKFTALKPNQNIEGISGLVLGDTIGDSGIKPERQSEVEGGFDLTLAGGRLSLEFTGYQKNITDLLQIPEVAQSSGFEAEIFNSGELRVRGIEAALAATPIQGRNFNWLTRTTFFLDRSKVLDLGTRPNGEAIEPFRTGGFGTALGAFEVEVGESATQIVAVISQGDSSFVAKVGDATPDFKVGFTNDLTLGNFDLYTLWDWQAGGTVINLTKLLFDFGQNTKDYDQDPRFVKNIGPVEVNDTLTAGERRIVGFGVETRPYIEPATYLKLREVSLSYTLPENLRTTLFAGRVRDARLTFSARNLLKFDKYSGFDPEVSNFGNQSIARNIDVAPYPPSRSFWLGIDFTF